MKKIIVGILIAGMVVSMSACGKKSETAVGSSQAAQENSAVLESADGSAAEENLSTASTEPEEKQEQEVAYEPGIWSQNEMMQNVYTNTSLGMVLTLPDGWETGTSEQLDAVSDAGQEVTGEEVPEGTTSYELYIINSTSGSNIAMLAEDVSIYGDISAQEYVDSLTTELQSLADQGVVYTLNPSYLKTIGATEFVCIDGTVAYQDNTSYQCYAVTEMGGQIITLIITGPAEGGQAECQAVLDSIQTPQATQVVTQ